MKLFSALRTLALLRRIAKALEGANRISRERMELEEAYHRKVKGARKADGAHLSVEEWTEAYRKSRAS